MDLYGLIWFIYETHLPSEKEFLARYLCQPEHYPELSEQVSGYCFRTLRSQVKHYANITDRVLLTIEYTPSKEERQLYNLLYAYINQPTKKAFPEMNQYDLALHLFGLLCSSTAAILQTIQGIIKRLKHREDGVFGLTDDILGGFTEDSKGAFSVISQQLHSKVQIEQAYRQTLATYEEHNRQAVSNAEQLLFTTFTKELADKINIKPQYIQYRVQEFHDDL